eukprot:10810496-Alexandrium_andersonii.AAC.1
MLKSNLDDLAKVRGALEMSAENETSVQDAESALKRAKDDVQAWTQVYQVYNKEATVLKAKAKAKGKAKAAA